LEELVQVLSRFLRNPVRFLAEAIHDVLLRVFSVKELPNKNAHGVQPEGVSRLRIEEDRPIVELLPEYDKRIC